MTKCSASGKPSCLNMEMSLDSLAAVVKLFAFGIFAVALVTENLPARLHIPGYIGVSQSMQRRSECHNQCHRTITIGYSTVAVRTCPAAPLEQTTDSADWCHCHCGALCKGVTELQKHAMRSLGQRGSKCTTLDCVHALQCTHSGGITFGHCTHTQTQDRSL